MNRLLNGALAVGSPGSWMRLQAAYEFESGLEPAWANYILVRVLNEGSICYSNALNRAAVACDIEPTTEAIRAYLIAARKGMESP